MKLLTLLITFIITLASSNAFAKSVVGKSLFCESPSFEFNFGLNFIDEENVEFVGTQWSYLELYVRKYKYETDVRFITIYNPTKRYTISRDTLTYGIGKQCYLKNSRKELLNYMTNILEINKQKILDENQI